MYHWSPGHLSTALNLNLAWLFSPVFTFKSKNVPTTFKRFRTPGILAIQLFNRDRNCEDSFHCLIPHCPFQVLQRIIFFFLPNNSNGALGIAECRSPWNMSLMTNYAWQGCEVPTSNHPLTNQFLGQLLISARISQASCCPQCNGFQFEERRLRWNQAWTFFRAIPHIVWQRSRCQIILLLPVAMSRILKTATRSAPSCCQVKFPIAPYHTPPSCR